MRRWWMVAIGALMATAAVAAQLPDQQTVKDPEGNTVGVLLFCNDCQSAGKDCYGGAESGFLNGKPCGKCLIESNYGTVIRYGYDLHVTGTLTDPEGNPVKNRFVKLFLPNGWGVRSRTTDQGNFRLMLGPTTERKSKQPLVIDVGARIDTKKGDDPQYAMYLLPETYKPCAAGAAKPQAQHGAKQKPGGNKKSSQ
jgi:hypothetical protein